MWYRRITEYNYIDPPPPANHIHNRKLREAPAIFGQSPFKAIVFGPPPSTDPEDLIGSRKRKSEHISENDIARFKRVRVLSKRTRVRRSKPGPEPFMRFATESRGFNAIAMSQAHQRTISKAGQTIPQAPPAMILPQAPSLPPLPPAFQTKFRPSAQHFGRFTESNSDDMNKIGGKIPHSDGEVDMKHGHHNTDRRKASSFDQDLEYRRTGENEVQSSPKSNSGKAYNSEYFQGSRYIKDEFHHAICYGDLRRLQHLVDYRSGEFMHWKYALLYQAVVNHNAPAAHLLLKTTVDVDAGPSSGWTALMRAAENGDAKLVNELLLYGACPSRPLASGQTALQIAAAEGHEEVVRILMKVAEDPDAQAALLLAVVNGHVAVTRMLLERGVDLSTRDAYGRTLLHRAAWNGCRAVAQLLLSKGISVDVKDDYGQTALHKAAACGEETMGWMLLLCGADRNARDDEGCTPLDWATANGFEALAERLSRDVPEDDAEYLSDSTESS